MTIIIDLFTNRNFFPTNRINQSISNQSRYWYKGKIFFNIFNRSNFVVDSSLILLTNKSIHRLGRKKISLLTNEPTVETIIWKNILPFLPLSFPLFFLLLPYSYLLRTIKICIIHYTLGINFFQFIIFKHPPIVNNLCIVVRQFSN